MLHSPEEDRLSCQRLLESFVEYRKSYPEIEYLFFVLASFVYSSMFLHGKWGYETEMALFSKLSEHFEKFPGGELSLFVLSLLSFIGVLESSRKSIFKWHGLRKIPRAEVDVL